MKRISFPLMMGCVSLLGLTSFPCQAHHKHKADEAGINELMKVQEKNNEILAQERQAARQKEVEQERRKQEKEADQERREQARADAVAKARAAQIRIANRQREADFQYREHKRASELKKEDAFGDEDVVLRRMQSEKARLDLDVEKNDRLARSEAHKAHASKYGDLDFEREQAELAREKDAYANKTLQERTNIDTIRAGNEGIRASNDVTRSVANGSNEAVVAENAYGEKAIAIGSKKKSCIFGYCK